MICLFSTVRALPDRQKARAISGTVKAGIESTDAKFLLGSGPVLHLTTGLVTTHKPSLAGLAYPG